MAQSLIWKYCLLGRHRRRALHQALFLLAWLRLFLVRKGLARSSRRLALWTAGQRARHGADPCSADDILWAVAAAMRRIPGTTCLMRALVAAALFKVNGIEAELLIGVRKEADGAGLAAHAWVLVGGRVVVGNMVDLDRYTALPRTELLEP